MSRIILSLAALVLVAGVARGADEKAYEIKLHRPDTKGAKFDISIAAAVRQQTRFKVGDDARPPADNLFGVELVGVVEILEADDRGNATRAAYTVERCVKVVEDADQVLVPKGKRIIAEAGKKETTFTIEGGGEVTEDQKAALDVVASLPRLGAPTADDLFGMAEKQKVGATWPVNAEPFVEDVKTFGMTFEKEKISGMVKLVGVEKENGVECLRVTAETKVSDYQMEVPEDWKLPEGMAFKRGSIELRYNGLLPVDPKSTQVTMSNSYTRTMVFEGQVRRNTATMEMVTSQAVELRAVPIKG